jgi:hypothetical protein
LNSLWVNLIPFSNLHTFVRNFRICGVSRSFQSKVWLSPLVPSLHKKI